MCTGWGCVILHIVRPHTGTLANVAAFTHQKMYMVKAHYKQNFKSIRMHWEGTRHLWSAAQSPVVSLAVSRMWRREDTRAVPARVQMSTFRAVLSLLGPPLVCLSEESLVQNAHNSAAHPSCCQCWYQSQLLHSTCRCS